MDAFQQPTDQVSVEEVEDVIRSVRGVTECRVVVNDWGGIEEVHVVATKERSAKPIIRDIESSLQAKYGLVIDHKKVSVAQLDEAAASSALRREYPRFIIQSHNVSMSRVQNWASVTVGLGTDEDPEVRWVGQAEGVFLRRQLLKLAAQATLDAVLRGLREGQVFALENVEVVPSNSRMLAVVTVTHINKRGKDEVLVGAAVVKGDEVLAVVRSTLDAVNRKASMIPRRNVPLAPESGDDEPPEDPEEG